MLTLSPAVRLRAADRNEGGTVALGDTVPQVFQSIAAQPASSKGLPLEMPKRPITGQRLPPCDRDVEVEIELTPGKKDTRSCWVELKVPAEKCRTRAYEYKGGCYLPIFPPPKVPQSVGP